MFTLGPSELALVVVLAFLAGHMRASGVRFGRPGRHRPREMLMPPYAYLPPRNMSRSVEAAIRHHHNPASAAMADLGVGSLDEEPRQIIEVSLPAPSRAPQETLRWFITLRPNIRP